MKSNNTGGLLDEWESDFKYPNDLYLIAITMLLVCLTHLFLLNFVLKVFNLHTRNTSLIPLMDAI
jgi:hypothetical protein